MSSENEKKSGEPGSGPKTDGNPDLWKYDLGEICTVCGYCAAEHKSKGANCPLDDKAPEKDRAWRGTKFTPGRKVEVVETGWVGAPPVITPAPGQIRASPSIMYRGKASAPTAKDRVCPHCGHSGPVDHECSHETCGKCGMKLDEPPVAARAFAATARPLDLHEYDEAGLLKPCECWRMAGFRNCPRHRHLCEPPDSPAFQTGVSKPGAPGTDMRELALGEIMVEGDRLSGGERIPAEWIGFPVKAIGVYRGVPLGEPDGAMGEPGVGEPEKELPVPVCRCGAVAQFRGLGWMVESAWCVKCLPASMREGIDVERIDSAPPAWLAEALGEARAADLADAGHRLAKCGVCGRLLYEKSGVFIHDGSGVEHVGVPTEIFDPTPANMAGVCFTCPPVGFFEALLNRLFPQELPELPEVPWAPPNAAPKGDVIHLTAVTEFSILDRLRLIVSGRLMTRAMIVCENVAGRTKAVMTVRPLAPGRDRE